MSKSIAVSGISVALLMLLAVCVAYVPTMTVAFLCAMGIIVVMPQISKLGVKYSLLVYAVSVTMMLLIFSSSFIKLMPAILFFMPYSIAKLGIERLSKKWLIILLKYIALNVLSALLIGFYFLFATEEILVFVKQYMWWALLAVNVLLLLYDFMMGQVFNMVGRLVKKN